MPCCYNHTHIASFLLGKRVHVFFQVIFTTWKLLHTISSAYAVQPCFDKILGGWYSLASLCKAVSTAHCRCYCDLGDWGDRSEFLSFFSVLTISAFACAISLWTCLVVSGDSSTTVWTFLWTLSCCQDELSSWTSALSNMTWTLCLSISVWYCHEYDVNP